MNCYASRTGTRRNLDALGNAGWGLLVSRAGEWRTEGWTDRENGERRKFRIVGDNGAWHDHQNGTEFDSETFERFLEWIASQPIVPDWIVLPDIVAAGLSSLELSIRWFNRCLSVSQMVLIAVQDGMTVEDISPFVGQSVGVFLGGSTEWKISTMAAWGAFCRARGIHYHVARVNSVKRMAMAVAAGADSIDGTSCSRFAVTTTKLTNASRQTDLWTPERRT
jgi:hypothetical protein